MATKEKQGKLKYEDLKLPFYTNSRPVLANLDVSDLVKAAVLAPLNVLLVGDTGTGKTQLVSDIYNSYFNGNIKEQGQGIMIRAHPEVDIYNEIFTEINIERAQRNLTKNIEALVYFVDELNRAPPVAQNQFFGLGDGKMDYKGNSIKLGKEGYNVLLATANLGNGEFQGTFETDKALYNRLHVALDFDYEMFKPTMHDRMLLDKIKANPNVKEAAKKDISGKIVNASKEIGEISEKLDLEEIAIINYLRFGLDNCQKGGSKEKVWPLNCQDCDMNKKNDSLCSLVRAPAGERTINAMKKYYSALYYLAKLKDPEVKIDPVNLMFKVFELTGAYQMLLNPTILKQEYYDQNPKMMARVAEELKSDYLANESFILASLQEASEGRKIVSFCKDGDQIGPYEQLKDEAKKKTRAITPYTNERPVGLKWVEEQVDFQIKEKSKNKSGKTQ